MEALANDHSPIFAPVARDDTALRTLIDAVLDASPGLIVRFLSDQHPVLKILSEPGRLNRL